MLPVLRRAAAAASVKTGLVISESAASPGAWAAAQRPAPAGARSVVAAASAPALDSRGTLTEAVHQLPSRPGGTAAPGGRRGSGWTRGARWRLASPGPGPESRNSLSGWPGTSNQLISAAALWSGPPLAAGAPLRLPVTVGEPRASPRHDGGSESREALRTNHQLRHSVGRRTAAGRRAPAGARSVADPVGLTRTRLPGLWRARAFSRPASPSPHRLRVTHTVAVVMIFKKALRRG